MRERGSLERAALLRIAAGGSPTLRKTHFSRRIHARTLKRLTAF
jgi:hypothetical protein